MCVWLIRQTLDPLIRFVALFDENETDERGKQRTNNRTDNEGDGNDNDDDNKASRSFPIPNRFLDSDGNDDVGVTIMTTMIREEDKHGPGDASVTI